MTSLTNLVFDDLTARGVHMADPAARRRIAESAVKGVTDNQGVWHGVTEDDWKLVVTFVDERHSGAGYRASALVKALKNTRAWEDAVACARGASRLAKKQSDAPVLLHGGGDLLPDDVRSPCCDKRVLRTGGGKCLGCMNPVTVREAV